MSERARTDPHRPGAIIPSEYTFVLWYELSSSFGGVRLPAIGVNCIQDREQILTDGKGAVTNILPGKHTEGSSTCCWSALRASGVTIFDRGGVGNCSVCGAHFKSGEVWRHQPTGEHIHLGHDCADKYGMTRDRSEWVAWHEQQRLKRHAAGRKQLRAEARTTFLASQPGLADALGLVHPILADLSAKLTEYGSLSPKQVAFAFRLAEEVRNPKPEAAKVPAPEGRITVRGTVVSTKVQASDYGDTLKMVVRVATPEGEWAVWSTVPAAIASAELKGREVEFTATLTRSDRDAHFAFAKRPTGGRIVV